MVRIFTAGLSGRVPSFRITSISSLAATYRWFLTVFDTVKSLRAVILMPENMSSDLKVGAFRRVVVGRELPSVNTSCNGALLRERVVRLSPDMDEAAPVASSTVRGAVALSLGCSGGFCKFCSGSCFMGEPGGISLISVDSEETGTVSTDGVSEIC